MEESKQTTANHTSRRRKRKRIPLPSFHPFNASVSKASPQHSRNEVLASSTMHDNDPVQKVKTSTNHPQQSSSFPSNVQENENASAQQTRPASRIAGVLPYQRHLQRLDPSLPRHFTRKELKIMNDETPGRGEEESPAAPHAEQQPKPASTDGGHPQQNADDVLCYSPKALFKLNNDEGHHTDILETQRFSQIESADKDTNLKSPIAGKPSSAKLDASSQLEIIPNEITNNKAPSFNHSPNDEDKKDSKDRIASQDNLCNRTVDANNDMLNTEQSTDSRAPASLPNATAKPQPEFRLFFVERGRNMHKDILQGPKANARARGAVVLDHFDRHEGDPQRMPTHFVVGTVSSPEVISRALGFDSVEELRRFMYKHKIQCATKAWAAKVSTEPYQAPRRAVTLQHLRVPYLELYTPLTPLPPPRTPLAQTNRSSQESRVTGNPSSAEPSHRRNTALAQIFKKLSKAYQEAPLDAIDPWRSYSFAMAASRLEALPFEIDSKESLQRAKKIKGFGSSTMAILHEYVDQKLEEDEDDPSDEASGQITVRRLQEVQTDPNRQALRTMMNIWGVGRAKALELVQAGYTSVDEIQKDFDQNQLQVTLQRNQYIGLICYNDILEEMDRAEAERIASNIKEAVHEYYSQAEVHVMGSYRRGSETCGDVDILMVHPKHPHKVPPKALGRIIDRLRVKGHVAYNLTQLSGMDTDAFETLPRHIARRLGQPNILRPKRDKDACSSYMGVFHSPTHPGKKRRVDIKFYPYRERVFASLYFTGNGYFNRSMRLWARRKYGYTLSDHGLFQDSSDNVRVMDAMNEAQIFRRLELVWKDPTERDGFDAVVGVDSKRATDLEAWSAEEFRREESSHAWIN